MWPRHLYVFVVAAAAYIQYMLVYQPTPAERAGEPAMRLNGEYTWDLKQPATLVDLDVTIRSGAFVAVVGPTGQLSDGATQV